MATFLNSTRLLFVTSNEHRKTTVLCKETLCEIYQYVGLHCEPVLLDCVGGIERWLYCFFVNSCNNTYNMYVKLVLEKCDDVLLVVVRQNDRLFFYIFLEACCLVDSTLHDVRSTVMYITKVYVYTSVERFIANVKSFNCKSHRVIWCTSENMFNAYIA